ncbi:hypothetical protein [Pseudomonas yamanorum]
MAINSHLSSNTASLNAASHAHPVRPPTNPFEQYSDSAVASAFGHHFQSFKHPTTPNATVGKIRQVAAQSLTGDAAKDRVTMLAREVIKRDNVLDALDSVDDKGVRDGVIGPWNPKLAAEQLSNCHTPPPPPKPCCAKPFNIYDRMPDSSLALAFGNNYKAFGKPENGVADVEQIYNIAGRQLSGNWAEDNMTLLAREIVKRSHVSHALDSIDDNGRQDGIIGYRNAQLTSAHLARR